MAVVTNECWAQGAELGDFAVKSPLSGWSYMKWICFTVFIALSPGVEMSHKKENCCFAVSVQEFVIDTPCENAEKMYIGNSMYGNYAAVFAQLILNGRSHGLSTTQKPRIVPFTSTSLLWVLYTENPLCLVNNSALTLSPTKYTWWGIITLDIIHYCGQCPVIEQNEFWDHHNRTLSREASKALIRSLERSIIEYLSPSSSGPHCFIVPVRDENGSLRPGVTAIDMMYKEGSSSGDPSPILTCISCLIPIPHNPSLT